MTPNLLLRSGIGPKAELKAAGVECAVDSPHVGKHLKDHLYLSIPFAMDLAVPLGELAGAVGMTEVLGERKRERERETGKKKERASEGEKERE
jgi:choline dehydrogenase-like flavoprotein